MKQITQCGFQRLLSYIHTLLITSLLTYLVRLTTVDLTVITYYSTLHTSHICNFFRLPYKITSLKEIRLTSFPVLVLLSMLSVPE